MSGPLRLVYTDDFCCDFSKGSFTRAISAAILGAIFSFWWMWRSRLLNDVVMRFNNLDPSHPPKGENRSRNRPCKRAFTLAIFAAISSAIFFFWCMWTSGWVMNVLSVCTLIWTFVTHPLVHIHQKKKIAPKIAAKIVSVNGPSVNTILINVVNFSRSASRRFTV